MATSANIALPQHHEPTLTVGSLPFKSPSVNFTELLPIPTNATQYAQLSSTLVLNPAFITQDFDLLRFDAAAYDQLPRSNLILHPSTNNLDHETEHEEQTVHSPSPAYSNFLISSPYNNPGHHLDLSSPHLTTPSRLFALALTALKPTRTDYATAPYTSALNFDSVLPVLRGLVAKENVQWPEISFYIVIFRSKLKPNIDNDYLYKLDYESQREACESGGLLKYWFGKTDTERRNLATCFWHSREDAWKGGLGPWHVKARAAGHELYESIVFSTHRFTILEGATGFKFEEWKEQGRDG
ncbi:hypothetical protein EJ02DRAFT_452996 [Clathrospora elynae]|uniref:Uncharacterized protein n=1 Tax=Clathrospora elynae TaxID=706981 RepID=A0A6A5SYW6_9PLEO|nr:hypothetical protein EJ02DRAFT_452996 [Clathrospora elynae]